MAALSILGRHTFLRSHSPCLSMNPPDRIRGEESCIIHSRLDMPFRSSNTMYTSIGSSSHTKFPRTSHGRTPRGQSSSPKYSDLHRETYLAPCARYKTAPCCSGQSIDSLRSEGSGSIQVPGSAFETNCVR